MKCNIPEGISMEMATLLSDKGKGDTLTAVALTCRGYCEYYRDDEGKESCGGLAAIRRGIDTGKIGLAQVSYLLNVPPGPAWRSGCLINELCSRCSYLEGDCDFMSESPPPDATPCGGYRLLQAFLVHGALTPDVVRALIENAECGMQNVE